MAGVRDLAWLTGTDVVRSTIESAWPTRRPIHLANKTPLVPINTGYRWPRADACRLGWVRCRFLDFQLRGQFLSLGFGRPSGFISIISFCYGRLLSLFRAAFAPAAWRASSDLPRAAVA